PVEASGPMVILSRSRSLPVSSAVPDEGSTPRICASTPLPSKRTQRTPAMFDPRTAALKSVPRCPPAGSMEDTFGSGLAAGFGSAHTPDVTRTVNASNSRLVRIAPEGLRDAIHHDNFPAAPQDVVQRAEQNREFRNVLLTSSSMRAYNTRKLELF